MTLTTRSIAGTVLGLVLIASVPRPVAAQEATSGADSLRLIARGAELFSRTCQRCHNPRGPGEWNDREWVIIMQHMETRANLTVEWAEAIRAFILASNASARAPGRTRGEVAQDTTEVRITQDMIEAGRRIFHERGTCVNCHGADLGEGPVAPSLKDDRWRNGSGTYRDILDVVRNGVQGTAMTAYPAGITDAMAKKAAAYVWAVSQGKTEP